MLENLKEVIRYVSDYEDEFVQMVMDTDMRQRNKELSQRKTAYRNPFPYSRVGQNFSTDL
ncbi:hypothetical protein KK424_16460 [Clostridioides difficile]|nr:hypothetical protein [Clostridioides difficile]